MEEGGREGGTEGGREKRREQRSKKQGIRGKGGGGWWVSDAVIIYKTSYVSQEVSN